MGVGWVGLDGGGGGGMPAELSVTGWRGDGGGEHLCDVEGGLSRGEGPVALLLLLLLDLLTLLRVV